MTSGQRARDRQRRETSHFETLFDLSRYDFRFPRYLLVKRRTIFNNSLLDLVNPIKIRKTLNRYNFEDNDFRSTSERSSEARNLAFWNPFRFIPIRLSIAEISSSREKRNFLIVYYFHPRRLFGSLARTSSRWLIPNSRRATDIGS